ncbi:conjugal transfer protein TraA [Rhizobium grahamii CCGE 502]|uniref:Conjugal transfer protein TraA n=1 Tax=Rhizobium grahamii CCGE 502 TaxID=990285 RepID=S3IMH3_9HYPH|nr:conjugal transfer protein TraA [Rhizobium grahamii CCGE 502]
MRVHGSVSLSRYGRLSDEQKTAIERVAGPERIAMIGYAGAGKTTISDQSSRR